MSSRASQIKELRLVVLGRTGAGKRSALCSILGLQDSEQDAGGSGLQECCKHRGEAAGRQVVVVSSPAWFGSGCDPEQRRRHISSFMALSSPGPHAFLLCLPVNQPADEEAQALAVLQQLFGPAAVSKHTLVLFTHTEELEEDEQLDDYLATWRTDLQELLLKCGGRHHTLETRGGDAVEGRAVEELVEKVELMVEQSGGQHLSCPLFQETEARVRRRQEEMVRSRRGEESGDSAGPEELEGARDEAERSIGDLDLDIDSIFPPTAVAPAPSLLQRLWELLTGWTRWLPTLVRRETLLGSLVGLFVGGPYGGMVGATVGSVATEVGRRKTEKTRS